MARDGEIEGSLKSVVISNGLVLLAVLKEIRDRHVLVDESRLKMESKLDST